MKTKKRSGVTVEKAPTNIVPRVYQEQAIQAALAGLNGRLKRALVVMATGLGKTIAAALTAKQFKAQGRILFLVHNNFILEHACYDFGLVFDPSQTKMATYNGLSKNGAAEANIVFATWQTMGRNLNRWARTHFDLVIVDEAHHTKAETYEPVMKYFNSARLAITATPDREDKEDIREHFGDPVVNITLEEAIAKGWLPKIEYHVIMDESLDDEALQQIMKEIKQAKRRFTMAEVNKRIFIRKREQEIARIINGRPEKAVVFCSSIEHAERMKAVLQSAATFHSRKGKNQEDTWYKNQVVLECLKDDTIRRVCTVNAFNEGVDVPSVGLVAFCRATDTLTIFRQQLGRGLRPGKEKLVVLDFVGNLERIKLLLAMVDKIKGFGDHRGSLEKSTREKFNVSGAGFTFTFSDEIVDLMEVLKSVERREFYETWEEAAEAARKLGILNKREYGWRYKEDTLLPSAPNTFYPNFPGWAPFLDTETRFYPTWQEAGMAARKLEITSQQKYKQHYKEDPLLPSNPNSVYPDFPGYSVFLRGEKKTFYPTWQEAGMAARKLGIFTCEEYKQRYKEDTCLPSNPNAIYQGFPSWPTFLGKEARFYPTWQEAGMAAGKLGATSKEEYRQCYKEDPLLLSNPDKHYSDFPGWPVFLGKKQPTKS